MCHNTRMYLNLISVNINFTKVTLNITRVNFMLKGKLVISVFEFYFDGG